MCQVLFGLILLKVANFLSRWSGFCFVQVLETNVIVAKLYLEISHCEFVVDKEKAKSQ